MDVATIGMQVMLAGGALAVVVGMVAEHVRARRRGRGGASE